MVSQDRKEMIRTDQEVNVGVCIIISKSIRFPTSMLKRNRNAAKCVSKTLGLENPRSETDARRKRIEDNRLC